MFCGGKYVRHRTFDLMLVKKKPFNSVYINSVVFIYHRYKRKRIGNEITCAINPTVSPGIDPRYMKFVAKKAYMERFFNYQGKLS